MKTASNSPNAISKKFDEQTYYSKMAQLAAASPKDAADAATTVRRKLHNAMMDAQMATQKSIELLAAGGTAAALGMMVGRWEAEEAHIVELWKKGGGAVSLGKDPNTSSPFVDGGVSEPGKLLGIDTDLLVTLGLAAASIFNVAGKYTPFVSATAIGGAAFYVGNLTRKIAMENAMAEIAKNPPKIEFKAAAA